MKKNVASRLFSCLLAVMLLLCMLPTSAFAATINNYNYTIEDGTNTGDQSAGPEYSYLLNTLKTDNPVSSTMEWEAGSEFTPSLPTETTFVGSDGNTYTLSTISVRIASRNSENKNVFEWYSWTSGSAPIQVPSNALNVNVYYKWTMTEGDTSGGTEERPYLTNFIFDVGRTVAQSGNTLTAKNEAGTDVYVVREDLTGMKSGLTLTYNTSMDMTKLGVFDGVNYIAKPDGEAWQVLLDWAPYISDTTEVDLHFVFDEKIDMDTLNTDNAELISDMFVLRNDVETFEKDGHELIVHCRWDSAKANENLTAKGTLANMIYFNGLEVGLPENWNGDDTITITNTGKVDGWMYGEGDKDGDGFNEIDVDMEIRGGDATDQFILTVTDKESLPGMDKTIVLEDGTEVDKDNVAAGDTVKFQLESNVPENLKEAITYPEPSDPAIVPNSLGNAGVYTLVFHDQMADELTLNADSIQVMLGDEEIADQYVTIDYDPDDDCTFEVTVDLAAMYNADVITEEDFGVTPITVNYTATLAEDTVAGAFTNTAWVVYPDGSSEHDTVTVYTYGIDIFKYDQADDQKGLDGAEFALYGEDDVTVAGDSTVTVNPDAEAIWTGASANGGHATIGGLDEGTYYLVETKAPDGYVKSDTPLKIVIPADADGTTYMVDVNFANTLIPHTGGMGTTMFTLGGAAILAAAGVLFIYSRKTRKDQEEN